jgi:nucleoside-diphosphate-sugar epimerase
MDMQNAIVRPDDLLLVTGSNGFIGSRVVNNLLTHGFKNLRCFVRPSSNWNAMKQTIGAYPKAKVDVLSGNLLSTDACQRALQGVSVVFHLAAGIEKTFPGSFLNSVVTTRNLLEAIRQTVGFKRIVNVSSFSVYTNRMLPRFGLLDENCAMEDHPEERFEPYCYGKLKQDELILDYGRRFNVPYVIVRPGAVYGPGKAGITARVGIDTFGPFMHLGGRNPIPLTYVDNCAEAIVLAGVTQGVEGEVFNIVDDDLPLSRDFLKAYKDNAQPMRSISIPYPLFSVLCRLWESYAKFSKGQIPPVFNRYRCAAYWKGNPYSNKKLKALLGWEPKYRYDEASQRYFEWVRSARRNHCSI